MWESPVEQLRLQKRRGTYPQPQEVGAGVMESPKGCPPFSMSAHRAEPEGPPSPPQTGTHVSNSTAYGQPAGTALGLDGCPS